MTEEKQTRVKRLIYQSYHRGCKEIDYLLGDFAINILPDISDKELEQYEALLQIDDSTLYGWFSGRMAVPEMYDTSVYKKIVYYNERQFQNI